MKKILLNVDYSDNTGKFWYDSSIKKLIVDFDPDKQTIHELVKEVCDKQDGMELTYKGKPQGNIYHDIKDVNGKIIGTKKIGYIYRGKSEIFDRNMTKPIMAFFDVWTTLKEVIDFEIESIDE